MNKTLNISIIIISWNVKNLLCKCLESIFKNHGDLNVEVIVVDNASTDGTQEMLEKLKKYPRYSLLITHYSNQNLGFAKANNIGIKKANGKYILLLNPDTEILRGALEKMYTFFEQHPDRSLAGCQHLNPDHTLQPSVRRFPTFWSQFLILHKIHRLLPNLKTFHHYFARDFDYQKTQPVEQIAGSFLMMRREVIEKIGLFDENFFIWFEDVDFCKRALGAGFKIFYHPNAKIIHHGGQSFKQIMTVKKQKMFNQSLLYYFKKHYGWLLWLLMLTAHLNSLLLVGLSSVSAKLRQTIRETTRKKINGI